MFGLLWLCDKQINCLNIVVRFHFIHLFIHSFIIFIINFDYLTLLFFLLFWI